MKTIRASVLRSHLSHVLKELQKRSDYIVVTKKGKPVSAMVDIDYFEDLLAATSKEFVKSIREARRDYRQGRVYSHEEVFGED